MNHIPSNCPVCNASLAPRFNPRGGGRFLGCSNFEKTGCAVSWCYSNSSFHGLPWESGRSSKNRGRVTSVREQTITMLVGMKGFSRQEAEEFLETFGVQEVQRLLAA